MDLGVGGRGGARRRTRRRQAAMASARQQQQPAPTQPQAQPAGNDPSSMLNMLKVLHKEGILTDQEFADKKAILVDRM